MITYLVLVACSFVLAAALTPLAARFAVAVGAVDEPGDDKKVHSKPMPRLGGLAIYAAVLLPCLVFLHLRHEALGEHVPETRQIWGFAGASFLILLLGATDDRWGLKAPVKLTVEVAAGILLYFCGFKVQVLSNPFGGAIDLGVFAGPVTVLWLVGIANAVNLIDGIDGAAAGISATAALALVVATPGTANPLALAVACCVIGSTLAFLLYNFHPAKVFMGDSGALFLGFALAAASVLSRHKGTAAIAMAPPIAALALPIADTISAIVRRLLGRRSVLSGDREHIHHKLLGAGLGQRAASVILYAASGVRALAAVGLAFAGMTTRIALAVALLLFLVVALAVVRRAAERRGNPKVES